MSLRVANLRLELGEPEAELPGKIAERLAPVLGAGAIESWRILRKSLDARRHDDIHFNYSAEVRLAAGAAPSFLAGKARDVQPYAPPRFEWPEPGAGARALRHRPVVVGSGPVGLLAGLLLAQSGLSPLVLERGRSVKDRVADVRRFDRGGPLDPESNYLFGEGGAGTFSDGKLTSRGAGPDVQRVLEILAEHRGGPAIVYEQRPHLGSNRLPLVVRTLRRRLEELGGEVRFSCRVEDLDIDDGRLRGLSTSSGYVPADVAVMAIGHSARDTYEMLARRGVPLEARPFQMGARIEQPQSAIDRAQYGPRAGHESLGAADYTATVRTARRDLYTFCMCAGGHVMPSASEPEHFCTNGMSESRHDSPFANSGLVVTIDPSEFGGDGPLAGVRYQQRVERLAFQICGGDYRAPLHGARDFLDGRASRGALPTSYRRGGTTIDLRTFLPAPVVEALIEGLPRMDRQFGGLFLPNATLTGPEARGSSPVRITRDPLSRESLGVAGLYPCGEGAGYAGGIISAAVDGLRAARVIAATYKNAAAH